MKNLVLHDLIQKSLPDIVTSNQTAHTTDTIYYIKGDYLHKFNLETEETEPICPQQFENVLKVQYLSVEKKICVCSSTGGDLFIIDETINDNVGVITFPHKISTISWSPNEELVAIVTVDGTVVTYTIDYENYTSFQQDTSSVTATVPDTVYVGWGSTATQFTGRGSRLLRPKTEAIDVIVQEVNTDTSPRISWRGNGEMFVVNYWHDSRRHFVVFELPCKALYRSEMTLGMGAVIAWRPAGNMIATLVVTTRNNNNNNNIIMFEKNGQKRFEFPLQFKEQITEIQWSPCGKILTVASEKTIALLTTTNYRWQQKQTLKFPRKIQYFEWLTTTQFTFKLLIITDHLHIYTFKQRINASNSRLAVIDGANLQMTNYRDCYLPPPLYQLQLTIDEPINFQLFNANNELICLIDCLNQLWIYYDSCTLMKTINLNELIINDGFPLNFNNFQFVNEFIYFVVNGKIYKFNYETDELNLINYSIGRNWQNLIYFKTTMNDLENFEKLTDNLFMPKFETIYLEIRFINNNLFIINLNGANNLFVNNNKFCDVNSFLTVNDYLLFTTKLNKLHCLRLSTNNLNNCCFKREIEQNAFLTNAIGNNVVLQMPRGNLEIIKCNLISIDLLNELLDLNKWQKAIEFVRLEKLNVNLLIDTNPKRFLNNIPLFLDAFVTVNELNNCLLEFTNTNCLLTIYENCLNSNVDILNNKIEIVFTEILKFFNEINSIPFITTIVLIHYNFFTLKTALMHLQHLVKRSENDATLLNSLRTCVNLLKTYGCTDEELFNATLQLYDLKLAEFVVKCTNLDPRIYLKQLHDFRQLPEIQQRYHINLTINKPEIAIKYLLRYGDEDELNEFLNKFKLWREAYENCSMKNRHFPVVSGWFAKHLSTKGKFLEAGVVLKRAQLYENALEQFKLGLCWQHCLNLMELSNLNFEKRREIYRFLVENLIKRNSVKEAVFLLEHYLNNDKEALELLIEHYLFKEALFLAHKYRKMDFVVGKLQPAIVDYSKYLKENLLELNDKFTLYKTRLLLVRKLKLEQYNNSKNNNEEENAFSDTESCYSTRSSRSSLRSTMSSRNRRKEARKKQDLREGGHYEDIALIRTLYLLIKEIDSKSEEIHNCCLLLLQETNENYSYIKEFHQCYGEIYNNLKMSLKDIWPEHFVLNNSTSHAQEIVDIENIEHLDLEFRNPPNLQVIWTNELFTH